MLGSAHDMAEKRIPKQTRGLSEGDELAFAGRPVRILEIPGPGDPGDATDALAVALCLAGRRPAAVVPS